LIAVAVMLPGSPSAFVPEADRVEVAVAAANVAAGRSEALRFELTLRIDDRAGVATGELVTHPTGLARLELHGARGLVERHLLLGSEHTASRNGEILSEPRAFLPPLFVLQAGNAVMLQAALESFGVLTDVIGLAPCGDADCYVIGDPEHEAPRPPLPEIRGLEELPPGESPEPLAEEPLEKVEPPEAVPAPVPRARLWIEMETYEIRGLDSSEGVQVRLGPSVAFEKLRVPAWLTIEEPGKSLLRFDVVSASRVAAPASAFSRSWLLAPVIPEQGSGEDAAPMAPAAPPRSPAPRPGAAARP
jgi:hypothetical protein